MKTDSEKIYDLEQKCKKLEFIIEKIFKHFKTKVYDKDDFTEFKEEIDEKIWRL